MKFWKTTVSALLLTTICSAHAGVIIGGTRVIYNGAAKESSLSVNNPDKVPYLIQSWIESSNSSAEKAPFIITPPLFRLDAEQQNILRILRVGSGIPEDKESLYWLNVKSIPSGAKQDNTLQIAVKTQMKLIYRPASLKNGVPDELSEQLVWKGTGNNLQVTNPTNYYMNFSTITVNGTKIQDASFVAPQSTKKYNLPVSVSAGKVSWTIINDSGAAGKVHQKTF